jgi:hypothetical protein
MNILKHPLALAVIAAGSLAGAPLSAATCDKVAADVRAAIEANPSKVLVIVEDAMIASEACACEIVKTALIASKANADLARQIVLTATNVAPNLTQLIAECARGVVAGDSTAGKTGKEVREVYEAQPVNSGGSDYASAPTDIRGAYIIQGGGGSIITTADCCGNCDEKSPPPKRTPQSPSTASYKPKSPPPSSPPPASPPPSPPPPAPPTKTPDCEMPKKDHHGSYAGSWWSKKK